MKSLSTQVHVTATVRITRLDVSLLNKLSEDRPTDENRSAFLDRLSNMFRQSRRIAAEVQLNEKELGYILEIADHPPTVDPSKKDRAEKLSFAATEATYYIHKLQRAAKAAGLPVEVKTV